MAEIILLLYIRQRRKGWKYVRSGELRKGRRCRLHEARSPGGV